MSSLHEGHPNIAQEFEDSKFTVAKTGAPFSAIAIDHAHEQNNGIMKGDGGTIGLSENSVDTYILGQHHCFQYLTGV